MSTPRAGGSQAEGAAADVHGDRCRLGSLLPHDSARQAAGQDSEKSPGPRGHAPHQGDLRRWKVSVPPGGPFSPSAANIYGRLFGRTGLRFDATVDGWDPTSSLWHAQ